MESHLAFALLRIILIFLGPEIAGTATANLLQRFLSHDSL
jgi:hypothetical protein